MIPARRETRADRVRNVLQLALIARESADLLDAAIALDAALHLQWAHDSQIDHGPCWSAEVTHGTLDGRPHSEATLYRWVKRGGRAHGDDLFGLDLREAIVLAEYLVICDLPAEEIERAIRFAYDNSAATTEEIAAKRAA